MEFTSRRHHWLDTVGKLPSLASDRRYKNIVIACWTFIGSNLPEMVFKVTFPFEKFTLKKTTILIGQQKVNHIFLLFSACPSCFALIMHALSLL